MKRIRYRDLRITNSEEKKELLATIEKVFDHGQFLLGPEVDVFEKQIADYCGRKFVVGVGSGTDALYLSLRALGIGEGDEVITTCLSWIATANAIALTGAEPVFADIGDNLNIDPQSIRRLITEKTKAILPVHFTGKVCDMDTVTKISDEFNIPVIEDAAQSFGAKYNERASGSFGTLSAVSMNPMKLLASCGEAGVILTDDPVLRERITALRYNGMLERNHFPYVGLNARIDTLQAAILSKRLNYLEDIIEKRRDLASLYSELLKDIVDVPFETQLQKDIYYAYTVKADRRDELFDYLSENGVEVQIQHPFLMCAQPSFIACRKDTQNGDKIVKRIISLPIHEKISDDDVRYVCRKIREFYEG